MNWSSNWSKPADLWTQVGDLAVVKRNDGWGWSVKHISTATKFDKAVPPGQWSKDQLIKWCQKVQKQHLEDWTALRALTKDSYLSENTFELRLRIRDWCLSVE